MRDFQVFRQKPVDGVDVIADGHHGKPRTMKWLGSIAGRRRISAAEQLGCDEEEFGRIERTILSDQPCVTVIVGKVMRREQYHVVLRGVQMPPSPIDDIRLGQNDAAFGMKVPHDELVADAIIRALGEQNWRDAKEREQQVSK